MLEDELSMRGRWARHVSAVEEKTTIQTKRYHVALWGWNWKHPGEC